MRLSGNGDGLLSMATKDIIVIGASLGGIEALRELAAGLPRDLPATVLVVQHIGATGLGLLPELLQAVSPLTASNARDGEPLRKGHIFVAPPDHHLLVEAPGIIRVTRGPKENRTRPAIDPLFRSAALAFGPRVIGVVLTGMLDDGTAGLWAVKARGGMAVVQHPEDALAPSMPMSALKNVEVNHCVPLKELAPLLVRLTSEAAGKEATPPKITYMETEVNIAREDRASERGLLEMGDPSLYACPECHGVLLQIKEGSNVRFRCHTGHAYSIETLLAEFTEKTEEVLWSSIRSIEETVFLLDHMARHLDQHNHLDAAAALRLKGMEAQRRADLVRKAVMGEQGEAEMLKAGNAES
jgi:two-component system chemotaxis response regulator CheB